MNRKDKFDLANTILRDGKLTPSARLVGWYIADHVNERRGYAWPPQDKIAADLGINERTVRRAIDQLGGYFRIIRRIRLASEYRPMTGQNVRSTGQNVQSHRTKCAFRTDKLPSHPLNDPLNDPMSRRRATRAPRTDDKKFEAFKAAYPKRDGSQGWQSARKHFDAAVKNGVSADALIAAASKFANGQPADTRGTRFVPKAETWLSKKDYREYLPAPVDREALAGREAAAAKAAKRLGYELTPEGFKKVEPS